MFSRATVADQKPGESSSSPASISVITSSQMALGHTRPSCWNTMNKPSVSTAAASA